MATSKFLVLVVDGTSAMGPFWKTILSDYLENIIRQTFSESAETGSVQLGLVQYNCHGIHNWGFIVRASPWTRDVDMFLGWLSAINFVGGGGPNEAAIADGLAEALVMFPKPNPTGAETDEVQAQEVAVERHCILVAASNPMLIPTPVPMPIISNGKFSCGIKTRLSLLDAQTVAKSYAECSVSLSVIAPKQFPTLREIFKAGIKDPESVGTVVPSLKHVKNPHFLVLLSNKFSEARAGALGDHSQSVIKTECE